MDAVIAASNRVERAERVERAVESPPRHAANSKPMDRPELAELIGRFTRYVRARLRTHDLARHGLDEDDIEQEVRIRLWAMLDRDPDKALPPAYIQKIIFSVVVDAVRRERTRGREWATDFDPENSQFVDHGWQPDVVVSNLQWARRLTAGLGELGPRRRRPVQLFLLGYTMRETAEALGLSVDAASKLVRRGLADLRKTLAGQPE